MNGTKWLMGTLVAALLTTATALPVRAQVQDQSEYYCSNIRQASNLKYKNLSENWWSAFVLKEFDKVAAAPGVDWTQDMKTPGRVDEWIDKAAAKGWIVKRGPKDAAIGAILVVAEYQTNAANLAIVKEVYDWGVVAETVEADNKGIGHVYPVTYQWMDLFKNTKQSFIGYIWPIKQADYDRAPQDFEARRVTRPGELQYKGWRQSWGPVWVLQEFDKIAPGGGSDWNGRLDLWLDAAAKKGWKISRDVTAVKAGAILLRVASPDKVWVEIVREVKADGISVECLGYPIQKVVREEIKFSDLPQKNFSGYILPEK